MALGPDRMNKHGTAKAEGRVTNTSSGTAGMKERRGGLGVRSRTAGAKPLPAQLVHEGWGSGRTEPTDTDSPFVASSRAPLFSVAQAAFVQHRGITPRGQALFADLGFWGHQEVRKHLRARCSA